MLQGAVVVELDHTGEHRQRLFSRHLDIVKHRLGIMAMNGCVDARREEPAANLSLGAIHPGKQGLHDGCAVRQREHNCLTLVQSWTFLQEMGTVVVMELVQVLFHHFAVVHAIVFAVLDPRTTDVVSDGIGVELPSSAQVNEPLLCWVCPS